MFDIETVSSIHFNVNFLFDYRMRKNEKGRYGIKWNKRVHKSQNGIQNRINGSYKYRF